jgi:ABC-type branched-subunit amino acid transport system substrate-binding protein
MNVRLREGRRSRRSLAPVLSILAAVSLMASGCAGATDNSSSGSGGTTASGPLSFYASLGTSGTSSTFAGALKDGMTAAVSTLNDKGGVLGRQVKLDVENNESDPTKAVSLLQNRITSDRPDLVWAGSTSSETLAMLGVTTREKLIALNNGSAAEVGDASKFPYSFSAGVTTTAIADYLASYLKGKGYHKVGLLTGSDAFGQGANTVYTAAFEKAGLTVASESYDPAAVEMDGPLARLGDGNPDAIVFSDFRHPAYDLKSRVKVGLQHIPFVGDLGATGSDLSSALTEEEKQGVTVATYKVNTASADRPGIDNLKKSLDSAGVKVASPLYLYALGYDTVLAYANAAEEAKSTDPDKIRAAMESGKGHKYPLALNDDIGWTKTVHLGSGEGAFAMIPITPLVDGQFQTAGK